MRGNAGRLYERLYGLTDESKKKKKKKKEEEEEQ
jgi:hypothetical protein